MTALTQQANASYFKWATISDLRQKGHQTCFREMEACQARFVAIQSQLTAGPYIWPTQPLYDWSRRVEYPFVAAQLPAHRPLRLLDAGSGVTFFPFYLRERYGADVLCVDTNPVFPARMREACEVLGVSPAIPLMTADLTTITPEQVGQFDAVMCISVVEHIPAPHRLQTVEHLWNLVAPGGKLLLTVDVTLLGNAEGLRREEVEGFTEGLAALVGPIREQIVAPHDILTTRRPGYAFAPVMTHTGLCHTPRPLGFLRDALKPLRQFRPLACLLYHLCKPGDAPI